MADANMAGSAIALTVLAIVVSIGQSILQGVLGTQTANNYDYNATIKGQSGLNTFATWIPTIALVVVAGVVIYIVTSSFGSAGGSSGI